MSKHVVCSSCTSRRLTCCSIFVFFLSLTFLSLGFFLPGVIDDALDSGITDFLALTPQSKADASQGYATWADWTDSRAPAVWYSVYLFNVTNPKEVVEKGVKPNVQQIGPYVYREYKKKLNTQFSTDEEGHAMVKYQDYVYYVYDQDRTGPHLNVYTDTITTVNFIVQALKGQLELAIPDNSIILDNIPVLGILTLGDIISILNFEYHLNLTQPYEITRNDLIELLFMNVSQTQAYTDETRLFKSFIVDDFLWGYTDNSSVAEGLIPIPFPGVLTNVTEDQVSSILYDAIYTGDGTDPTLLRSYVQWQEMEYLAVPINQPGNKTGPLWGSPRANRIHGTDGTQFPRNLKKGQPVTTFITDLFRSAVLNNYNEKTVSYKGIDLLRFTINEHMFSNVTVYPSNIDYNITGPSGLLNVQKVEQNIPIVFSKPHFLDVGSPIPELVTGLTPNRDVHDTFIDVEPITGAAMNAAKRIQINVHVEHFNATSQFANKVWYRNETWFSKVNPQTLIPVAWVEEAGSASDSQAHDFKSQVYVALSARYYVKWVGYIAGIIWCLLGIFLFYHARLRMATETMKSIQSTDIDGYDPLLNSTGYTH